MFAMRPPPFSFEEASRAIDRSLCWSDSLRQLGYRPVGHNIRTLKKYACLWGISVAHFDPNEVRRRASKRKAITLDELLVENSDCSRSYVKKRLFEAGLKDKHCEVCGQDELWHGRTMSLILDHVNGVSDDNRLENLRIVCPNCAATLNTHCGRNLPRRRTCPGCGTCFAPDSLRHRYCSRRCVPSPTLGVPRPGERKAVRPPYQRLLTEIDQLGYSAVGRSYGVSDNAVRKWVRFYERAGGASGDVQPP